MKRIISIFVMALVFFASGINMDLQAKAKRSKTRTSQSTKSRVSQRPFEGKYVDVRADGIRGPKGFFMNMYINLYSPTINQRDSQGKLLKKKCYGYLHWKGDSDESYLNIIKVLDADSSIPKIIIEDESGYVETAPLHYDFDNKTISFELSGYGEVTLKRP